MYQQLNQRLRTALSDEYRGGEKFLTEREISQRFAVSRATANKALASLVSEGLLEFRRGVGTFVRRDLINYDLRSLVSFVEKARAAGKRPRTRVLTLDAVTADSVDARIAAALEVEGEAPLWHLERVRSADDVPVILEDRYLVAAHCTRLTKTQAAGSLYAVLSDELGLQIAGADEILRAVTLRTPEARLLEVAARSPALEVTAVAFLDEAARRPLWWERTLYRGDQYEFHSRLGPIRTATPPRGTFR